MTNGTYPGLGDHGLEWAGARLQEQFGHLASIDDLHPVKSRLGGLYRLRVTVADEPQIYYLKKYAPAAVPWAEHQMHLTALSATFAGTEGFLPVGLVAVDPEQGLLLTAGMSGHPLADLHRGAILWPSTRNDARVAWREVGRWLARLHSRGAPAVTSATRAAEIVDEITSRCRNWQREDPSQSPLAEAAIESVAHAVRQLADKRVTLTLCHGDVSTGNILVHGGSIGLIDWDDMRVDMPAIDVSQALLEIKGFGRTGLSLSSRRSGRTTRFVAALTEGYNRGLPIGPEFWLPHFRNLATYLLTMARVRPQLRIADWSSRLRYRGLLDELRRTITDVQRGSTDGHSGS